MAMTGSAFMATAERVNSAFQSGFDQPVVGRAVIRWRR